MLKGKLAENWLKLIRLYTYHSPIRKGKYRLLKFALEQVDELPANAEAHSRDGRVFAAKMETRMYDMVYFLGEYENYVTKVIGSVVKSGDVCFDVGANFGWFTTFLLSLEKISNKKIAEIHAFEPLKKVFENLSENVRFCESPERAILNNFALTDKISETVIYIIDRLGSGHSSLAKNSDEKITEEKIHTKTFDDYVVSNAVENVDFIKIDIEGSELKFLKGGTKMFAQKIPPVMVMEMALDTTKPFGYLPDDLVQFIRESGEYDFYALDEINETINLIEGFKAHEMGANVLCMPKNADQNRLSGLKIIK